MNRASRVLPTAVLSFTWFMAGCGGGPTGTINPPPPPPPANPVPAITTVTPSFVLAGSAVTPITITGTGFISSSTAQWNGAALSTTYNSATSLSVALPAADLTGSSASLITVQNPAPGGGMSAGATFDVNSPVAVITAISPRYVPLGSPATITVTGTGFESNSIVMWNTAARPTTFVSATSLQVALSAADLQNQGTGSLTVSNPAPAASTSPAAPLVVTSQPVPVIQSVSIASSTIGPAIINGGCAQLQVTIAGQNFANDSTIQANGVTLPTNVFYGPNPTILINDLPLGFVSAPLSHLHSDESGPGTDRVQYVCLSCDKSGGAGCVRRSGSPHDLRPEQLFAYGATIRSKYQRQWNTNFGSLAHRHNLGKYKRFPAAEWH